jgi:hypothetical protein
MSPQPGREVRIGDAEREAAVHALGEHFAAGRLTKEEYDERSEQAWAARTGSQLGPLFADLPRPAAARQHPVAAPGGPSYGRGRPGWWAGAWMVPLLVLLVLAGMHLMPFLLVFLLVWFLLARRGGRSCRRDHGWGRRHDHWTR